MNDTAAAIIELFQVFYLFDYHSRKRQGLEKVDGS